MLLGIEGIIARYQSAEVILRQLEISMKSLQAEVALVKDKEVFIENFLK